LATLREIRRRIRSVRNISKITRAMETVAAARMRRAQNQALATRPYAEKAAALLSHLASQRGDGAELHPLLTQRDEVQRIGVVMITSSRGLAGGYNHNVIRKADELLEHSEVPVTFLTVGRVGRNAMLRSGQHLIADFEIPDQPKVLDVAPIARLAIDGFLAGELDQVYLLFTRFVNTMVQMPEIRRLLPLWRFLDGREIPIVRPHAEGHQGRLVEYIYEPGPEQILDVIVPRFTELQVYEAILESLASEHSARMVAMRAATENAEELIGELTLTYNRARQDAITKEVLDIVGGTEALARAEGR